MSYLRTLQEELPYGNRCAINYQKAERGQIAFRDLLLPQIPSFVALLQCKAETELDLLAVNLSDF